MVKPSSDKVYWCNPSKMSTEPMKNNFINDEHKNLFKTLNAFSLIVKTLQQLIRTSFIIKNFIQPR